MTTAWAVGEPPAVTLTQLRAAWAAMAAGAFDVRPVDWSSTPVDVVVLGAHGGSGATTLALALAHAGSGRVLELAGAARAGLIAAGSTEHGRAGDGWHRATRDDVIVEYLERWGWGNIPAPSPAPAGGLTIVDAADLARGPEFPGPARALLAQARLVVVTSTATVPGMRHLAVLLDALGQWQPSVAVRGLARKRWPRAVVASMAPQVRALEEDGRLLVLPHDDTLATHGVTPDPLPKPVLHTAHELLRSIPTAEPPPERTA